MRIAQIAPLVERVPPKKYGGTERVIHALTEELVRRGHEVTLFATGDSITSARLHGTYPRPLREARVKDLYGVNHWTLLTVGEAYQMQKEFDVIHDHLLPISLPTANLSETPVVMTAHGAFSQDLRKLMQSLKRPNIVTISNAQMFGTLAINHAGTVYNGLSMEQYPFGEKMGEYLLYVGRFSMEKGVHIALDVANELDLPLIIAAKLDEVHRGYYEKFIVPELSPRIQWIGEVDEEIRNALMSNARCFLHPVQWREPFGLTMIEAMACGCPVVAFNHGSVPEVVQHGKTGFVVEDADEMAAAVERIGEIDRAACREYALSTFTTERMVDGYEEIYRKVTKRHE